MSNSENVLSVVGGPDAKMELLHNTAMKPSQFNIIVEDAQVKKGLVFNSLYGSLTLLQPEEMALAKCILEDPATTPPGAGALYDDLVKQRYLVANDIDERAIVVARKHAGIRDQNRLDLIIMPTLDCNFACTYCYEEHPPSRMTEQTREAIKAWLTKEIPKHKVFLLIWFGGEPLMGYRTVLQITRHALQVAQQNNVAFIGHMTTNGYLLDQRRVKELIDANVFEFQITLDGAPEAHNRLRILRNGRGTFDKVFQNILVLARADERTTISLRVNFNGSNLHSIPNLLSLFPADVRSKLDLEMEPIFGSCTLSAVGNLPAEDISQALAEYCSLAEGMGYRVKHGLSQIRTGRLVYCLAERESQLVINYNGDVYKCGVATFRPEDRVGYIVGDGTLVKVEERWNQYVSSKLFEEQCYMCKYLPLCMGGCRSARLKNEGTGSFCSLIPTNTTTLLRQVVRGRFGNLLRAKPEETRRSSDVDRSALAKRKEVISPWKS